MSPETTYKLMGFYMEVLILGAILQYMVYASLSCILWSVKGYIIHLFIVARNAGPKVTGLEASFTVHEL